MHTPYYCYLDIFVISSLKTTAGDTEPTALTNLSLTGLVGLCD